MSTTGKEYKLAIRIAGIIDKTFNGSLSSAKKSLNKTIAAIDADFTKLDKGFNSIANIGKKSFQTIATAAGVAVTAIGAATAASIKVGSEFESAFAGVKKTVDATEAEYERLRQDILDMSNTMPTSATEIAGVMEIAGQLGIANNSLTDFTETMINMGVSTNLSAEEAATALAKFANITNMADYGSDGISNFERLGSTIVDLGNNFATTEEDIVNLSTHLAAAGSLAGLSEDQILGISAAMSSVGIAAESGGSSMSTVLMNMQQAVAEGKEGLSTYAKTAGMTAQEFEDEFRKDAGKALNAFIEGIGTAGEDSYGILKELGLSTIRVRKTILGLAGAEGLLEKSMTMANDAWDENTALAIEAGKRYATADSQMQIMKNAFTELGIVAYEELREPFVDTLGAITTGVTELTDYVGSADGISKWIDNIGTTLPTLQRKFKKYGEPVFNGIVGVGKWIVKHGNGLISLLVGVGTALTAYKIASSLTHVVNALLGLGSLNPVTLTILGVVAALGAFAGAVTAYNTNAQDMVNANLAEHFGDIALSMEDIQAIAEHILSSDSLGGVKKALEAFEDLDAISATMESSISELDKMNWKVSIGMELTADEQESYKAAIQDYVSSAQEYALQSQYAVSLNLTESGLEDSNVVNKIKQFYSDKYVELEDLGQSLNMTVTEAFNNGLLDIKETKVISEIQAQMAAIEESLATGEFDAKLSLLEMEYAGGASLSSESFMNLQEELGKQAAEASEIYKEAYTKNYASIQAAYDAGEYLTYSEYESALSDIQKEYLNNIRDLNEKAASFQIDTIMDVYGEEINAAFDKYSHLNGESLYKAIMGDDDFEVTRGAISELLELMGPTMEGISNVAQQYEEAGDKIPFAIQAIVEEYSILKSVVGDGTDLFSLSNLPNATIPIDQYTGLDNANEHYKKYKSIFGMLSEEAIGAAVKTTKESLEKAEETVIDPAVMGLYMSTEEFIKSYYSLGFKTLADVEIELNPSYKNVLNSVPGSLRNPITKVPIGGRAKGGLATRPEITWFAEECPEMAIPIDGSRNSISLWEQTGRLLGMDSAFDGLDLGSSSSSRIEYNPTLQFYGEAPSKADLTDALRISQDEFERLMDKYQKTHGRVAFG